jgi:HK97 family phage prohead protease
MKGEWLRLGLGGVVPISWDLTSKADDGPGELEGWASVFNVVDEQDEIVERGAFKRTIDQWRSSGRTITLTKSHDMSNEGVIGSISFAEESAYGLRIRAKYASTATAQEQRVLAKEGHIRGLSIFGAVLRDGSAFLAGKSIRVLKEVGLLAVALTPYPANTLALTTAAKDVTAEVQPADLDPRWEEDMRAALRISSAPVRRVAIDSLMKARFRETVTITEPATGETATTGDDVGNTDRAMDDAATYALSLIGESGPDVSPPGGDAKPSLVDLEALAAAEATSAELDALEAEMRSAN